MNSEKVKEIKKALEELTQHKPINCIHNEYVEACGMYCRHHREFVADMEIKNGQTCENCNKFTATNKVKEYTDILTLINELENRLDVERIVLKKRSAKLEKAEHDRDRYKRRIEKLRAELNSLSADYAICQRESHKTINSLLNQERIAELKQECAKNAHCLQKFAERLKEKLEENSPIAGYDLEDLEFDGETIQESIDETLKEFIGEKENDKA